MKPEREFFDVTAIPLEEVAGQPGMTQRILARDDETGDVTRLLYFPPGHQSRGVQIHDFWEEVYILSGAMHDLTLDQTFTAGMYACRPPGMPHGPWRAPDGAMTFEIRYFKQDLQRPSKLQRPR